LQKKRAMAPAKQKKRAAVKQEDEAESRKRAAVKQEDEAESRKTPRVNNGEEASEEETGGNAHVHDAVAAPPVACAFGTFVRFQVKRLLDPSAAETTIDYLEGLGLHEEENHAARDAFKSTDICKNLVAAMEQNANSNSAIFQTKCCNLIVTLCVRE
jgi:hypothetical protein